MTEYTIPTEIQECLDLAATPGFSLRKAAKDLNLSRRTVQRHRDAATSGSLVRARGTVPSLPAPLLAEIAVVAKTAARNGFGLSKKELRAFVGKIVEVKWNEASSTGEHLRRYCRFVNKYPADEWVEKFMHDHNLSLVKPSPLERCRSTATSDPEIVYNFYDLLGSEMDRLGLHDKPENVWNLDETAFFVDPSRIKVVSQTGQKGTHRITAGPGRQCFSVMACVSAAGIALPPLIIFEAKNLHTTWHGTPGMVPEGTTYACSDSGWMSTEIFTHWFRHFLTAVPQRPLLMVFDGHKTHLGLEVIQMAIDVNVSLLKLPSHTTNRLQPLDVSCFRPLKLAWDERLIGFQRANAFKGLKKRDFVDLLSEVWAQKLTVTTIQNGFRKTGVFPTDRSRFPRSAFNPTKLQRYEAEHLPGQVQSYSVADQSTSVPGPSVSAVSPSSFVAATSSSADRLARLQLLSQLVGQEIAAEMQQARLASQPSPSLNEIFLTTFAAPRTAPTGDAETRRKLDRSAVILTQSSYVEHTIEINRKRSQKKPSTSGTSKKIAKKVSAVQCQSDNDEDDDVHEEYRLPPPLSHLIRKREQTTASISQPAASISQPAVIVPQYCIGDYVVIAYCGRKSSTLHYAGLILSQGSLPGPDPGWVIKCLRLDGKLGQFRFPRKQDIAVYANSAIVYQLGQPKLVGSALHFPDDLTHFTATLR